MSLNGWHPLLPRHARSHQYAPGSVKRVRAAQLHTDSVRTLAFSVDGTRESPAASRALHPADIGGGARRPHSDRHPP